MTSWVKVRFIFIYFFFFKISSKYGFGVAIKNNTAFGVVIVYLEEWNVNAVSKFFFFVLGEIMVYNFEYM